MAKKNDASTTLRKAYDGDVMDESIVTQGDGVTQAKRPRVVIGDDAGNLVDTITGEYVMLAVADPRSRAVLNKILLSLHRIEKHLAKGR